MCFSTPGSHQIPNRIEGKEKQGEVKRWGKRGIGGRDATDAKEEEEE